MSLIFTVSPDFNTKHLAGWFVVNTLLQRQTGEGIHLETFDDFESLHAATAADQIDLIYANPFDAVARPHARPDEAIIAAKEGGSITAIEHLRPGTRIASTDNPDVHMMGMIMIEPADLDAGNVTIMQRPNYVLVAKSLLDGDADIGFFLAETYDELSETIRKQLRVLVRSQIQVISHVFLAHPRVADKMARLRAALLAMAGDEKGRMALADVGIDHFEPVEREEVEFMIDLMVALTA